MAHKLPSDVQPGDLITAQFMNQVLRALEELDDRLIRLEGRRVVIDGIQPDPPLRVGEELRVLGRNFATPAVNNQVTIEGVPVTQFKFASTDQLLVFDIPPVPGLPSQGDLVTLRVANLLGADSTDFFLLPAVQVPTGRVEVLYVSAPVMPFESPNIELGGSYIFTFDVTAFVTQQETYRLTPSIDASDWTVELLEDTADVPRASSRVTIPGDPAGVSRTVRLRLGIPPGSTATTGSLQLAVAGTTPNGQVNPGNAVITVAVGSPPPTPDSRVRVSLRSLTQAEIVGGRVRFNRDSPGAITFNLTFTEAGTFGVAAPLRLASGWTAEVSPTSISVEEPASGAPVDANQDVSVILTGGAGAADTDLLLTVTSSDTATPVDVTYVQPVSVV